MPTYWILYRPRRRTREIIIQAKNGIDKLLNGELNYFIINPTSFNQLYILKLSNIEPTKEVKVRSNRFNYHSNLQSSNLYFYQCYHWILFISLVFFFFFLTKSPLSFGDKKSSLIILRRMDISDFISLSAIHKLMIDEQLARTGCLNK